MSNEGLEKAGGVLRNRERVGGGRDENVNPSTILVSLNPFSLKKLVQNQLHIAEAEGF